MSLCVYVLGGPVGPLVNFHGFTMLYLFILFSDRIFPVNAMLSEIHGGFQELAEVIQRCFFPLDDLDDCYDFYDEITRNLAVMFLGFDILGVPQ